MADEKGVDDRIDDRASLMLVADAETHVQHQGQAALRRVARGIVDGAHHATVDRDAAARIVRDLQADDLRARGHPVESRHIEQVVTGRDAGHVGAVARGVEEQVEDGRAVRRLAEVRDDRERLLAECDGLVALAEVVQRHFVLERAVEVRVEECDPPV